MDMSSHENSAGEYCCAGSIFSMKLMMSTLCQHHPIWRPVQGEVCVAKRTAGSAGGNARYLQSQSGTNKWGVHSGNYACICDSVGH